MQYQVDLRGLPAILREEEILRRATEALRRRKRIPGSCFEREALGSTTLRVS